MKRIEISKVNILCEIIVKVDRILGLSYNVAKIKPSFSEFSELLQEMWTDLFGFVPPSQLKQLVPHSNKGENEVVNVISILRVRVEEEIYFHFYSGDIHRRSAIRLICPILLARMRRNHTRPAVYKIVKRQK
jgi:hypothetical protein